MTFNYVDAFVGFVNIARSKGYRIRHNMKEDEICTVCRKGIEIQSGCFEKKQNIICMNCVRDAITRESDETSTKTWPVLSVTKRKPHDVCCDRMAFEIEWSMAPFYLKDGIVYTDAEPVSACPFCRKILTEIPVLK